MEQPRPEVSKSECTDPEPFKKPQSRPMLSVPADSAASVSTKDRFSFKRELAAKRDLSEKPSNNDQKKKRIEEPLSPIRSKIRPNVFTSAKKSLQNCSPGIVKKKTPIQKSGRSWNVEEISMTPKELVEERKQIEEVARSLKALEDLEAEKTKSCIKEHLLLRKEAQILQLEEVRMRVEYLELMNNILSICNQETLETIAQHIQE